MAEEQYTPPTELPEPVMELNLDDLPKVNHNWVDRGLVWSCETTSHPYHQTGKSM